MRKLVTDESQQEFDESSDEEVEVNADDNNFQGQQNELGRSTNFLFGSRSPIWMDGEVQKSTAVLSKYLFITTFNVRASSCRHVKQGTNCTG